MNDLNKRLSFITYLLVSFPLALAFLERLKIFTIIADRDHFLNQVEVVVRLLPTPYHEELVEVLMIDSPLDQLKLL